MTAHTLGLTITKEVERMRQVEDPASRAREARRIAAVCKRGETELSHLIRDAARELREQYGLSWPDVGSAVGVSRARAQQMCAP